LALYVGQGSLTVTSVALCDPSCLCTWVSFDTDVTCSQNNRTPLDCARPGSTTAALLMTEMELVDEHELTKSAAKLT
jgi:hypothetical protein